MLRVDASIELTGEEGRITLSPGSTADEAILDFVLSHEFHVAKKKANNGGSWVLYFSKDKAPAFRKVTGPKDPEPEYTDEGAQ